MFLACLLRIVVFRLYIYMQPISLAAACGSRGRCTALPDIRVQLRRPLSPPPGSSAGRSPGLPPHPLPARLLLNSALRACKYESSAETWARTSVACSGLCPPVMPHTTLPQVDTLTNPLGLCAISCEPHAMVLACPGIHKGQVCALSFHHAFTDVSRNPHAPARPAGLHDTLRPPPECAAAPVQRLGPT